MPRGVIRAAFGGAVAVTVVCTSAFAQILQFDIPSEEAGRSLPAFARQAGIPVIAPGDRLHGVITPEIKGKYDVDSALERLLKGTGLIASRTAEGGIAISPQIKEQKEESEGMSNGLRNSTSVLALIVGVFAAVPAHAQNDTQMMETVTVTGFRASLERALTMKRDSLDATDSIMSEDIAKFPDKNVSESLQRIPGVALARGTGEGEQITVRGLGPTYTRVRINGIEAMSTTTDSNGTNRGRGFDFNVFASELFSQLTVRKSATASVEEGSLGATVDLHTAHPFDHPGLIYTVSGQLGYQDLAGSINPRVAALVSDTFLGGRLGVLVSAAYTYTRTEHVASDSGVWNYGSSTSYKFGSVKGATSGTEFNTVNAAYHARFPRYGFDDNKMTRIGLTSSVQWQPDDHTLFTLDGLFADYGIERYSSSFEPISMSYGGTGQLRGTNLLAQTLGMQSINALNYKIDKNNTMTYLEATNVGLRSESRIDHFDTRFMQLTLDGSHDFSESFKVHGVAGWTESHHRNPVQTTLTADYNCTAATSDTGTIAGCPGGAAGGAGTATNPYVYDYSSSGKFPYINYGNVDPTSTNGFFLSQIRERAEFVYNSFRTVQMDFDYKLNDTFKFQGGIDYKNYGFNTYQLRRSDGTTSNMDYVIPAAVAQSDLSQYSKVVGLDGVHAPKGTATSWWTIDINKMNKLYGIWDQKTYASTGSGACASGCGAFYMGIEPGLSSTGTVGEDDYGGWLQANWDAMIYDIPFRGNIGARYVETQSKAMGYNYNVATKTLERSTVSQSYHDFLPSLNVVLEPASTFLIRLNASYAMARPDMMSLLPYASVSVSGSSYGVTIGNPYLKPYRSKNIDLSYEWYYHKGSMLSLAFFYKHLDSFVQSQVSTITYNGNPYGLSNDLAVAACGSSYGAACNENVLWQFTRPVNTKGGPLFGTEINWQQQLDFLPHPFDNMGILGSATFVQARQRYLDANGALVAIADPTNMSRTGYSGTFYYDDQVFQARVTGSFRSKYLNSVPSSYGMDMQVTEGSLYVDMSTSYKFNEQLTFSFDVQNLTDQDSYGYYDSTAKRASGWGKTGRVFFIGAKYNN